MVNSFWKYFSAPLLKPLIYRRGLLRLIQSQCILCGDQITLKDTKSDTTTADICQFCRTHLPWLNDHCLRCALPLPRPITATNHRPKLCGQCQQKPPPWQRATAAWIYQQPIASLVTQLKYQRQYTHGRALAKLAAPIWAHSTTTQSKLDWLMPTPLHWYRSLRRGFNQSLLITQYASQELGIPIYHGIKRKKYTPSQQLLNAKKRRNNLQGAFSITHPALIKGRSIALIDDVMTTGSTAHEITQTLLRAGAKDVYIWILARTPDQYY